MEQLDCNILQRWFVGLGLDEPAWDVTMFTKNRKRLLAGDVAQALFAAVLAEAQHARLLSNEHFSVDGTLMQAWSGHKSFRPRRQRRGVADDDPGNPTVNFHGEQRSNVTHASTTDPEPRLATRGPGHEAKLAFRGHVLMANRHGLAVAARVAPTSGTAGRTRAVALVRNLPQRRERVVLGADKGYDTRACLAQLRVAGVTPHVACTRRGALDRRTLRHVGYAVAQRVRSASRRSSAG